MKPSMTFRKRGFTLLETVIAIGVLSVLLTGFIVVFTPAAQGIKKSINVQQADRLASTLEQEVVTLRTGQEGDAELSEPVTYTTGFAKAFYWIKNSNVATSALLAYQYRGNPSMLRDDNTATPVDSLKNAVGEFDKLPGKDYVVVSMLRRVSDSNLSADLAAVEGPVYVVKCTQLKFSGRNLILTPLTPGSIVDPKKDPISDADKLASAADYPEAVIAYAAYFYQLPSSSASFVKGTAFTSAFDSFVKNPVFTRNFAVGR